MTKQRASSRETTFCSVHPISELVPTARGVKILPSSHTFEKRTYLPATPLSFCSLSISGVSQAGLELREK